jgi:hypothetical protein
VATKKTGVSSLIVNSSVRLQGADGSRNRSRVQKTLSGNVSGIQATLSSGAVSAGWLLPVEGLFPWVLNLAPQDVLGGARLEYVDIELGEYYEREGIASLALPMIGAGLGGLEWPLVRDVSIRFWDLCRFRFLYMKSMLVE